MKRYWKFLTLAAALALIGPVHASPSGNGGQGSAKGNPGSSGPVATRKPSGNTNGPTTRSTPFAPKASDTGRVKAIDPVKSKGPFDTKIRDQTKVKLPDTKKTGDPKKGPDTTKLPDKKGTDPKKTPDPKTPDTTKNPDKTKPPDGKKGTDPKGTDMTKSPKGNMPSDWKHHNPYPNYHRDYGRQFAHGTYYAGQNHRHWSFCSWDNRYGCYCYWDPCCSRYYYYCQPDACYYPVAYCPYRTYTWTEPVCNTCALPAPINTNVRVLPCQDCPPAAVQTSRISTPTPPPAPTPEPATVEPAIAEGRSEIPAIPDPVFVRNER